MAAIAAPEKLMVSVPVDARTEDESMRGSITYHYNTPSDPTGVFSFSWYYRHEPTDVNRNVKYNNRGDRLMVYLLGLMTYIRLTEQPAFPGWKVVLYTDQNTLDNLQLIQETKPIHFATTQTILTHPNVIVAVCSWPEYYTGNNSANTGTRSKKIDGIILRMFRNRAFCEFHRIPVFVRDADTIFNVRTIEGPTFEPQVGTLQSIMEWENAVYKNLEKSGKQFLVASNIQYRKPWHYNNKTKMYTMGFLAGLTTSLGGLPEWDPANPNNLWNQSIDYVRGRSEVINNPPIRQLSNLEEITYGGKDEQIISFVWLPAIVDRTFFFYESVIFHDYIRGGIARWNNPPENVSKQNYMYLDSLKGFLQEIVVSLPERSITLNTIIGSPSNKYFRIRPSASTPPPGGANNYYLERNQNIIRKELNTMKGKSEIRPNFDFNTNLLPYIQKKTGLWDDSVYFINEAFRDPLYDIVLRTVWTHLNRAYQAKKVTEPTKGGRRRRQTRKQKARRGKLTRRR